MGKSLDTNNAFDGVKTVAFLDVMNEVCVSSSS